MLFSLNYKSTHKQQADEIRCPINQLGTLYEFIKNNPDKRYCIVIQKDIEIKKILEQVEYVKEVARDYTIECGDLVVLIALLESGYNAFARFPVTDWETFTSLQSIGVSDIYIDGPLGFQIDRIIKAKGDTKIRVSPSVSPNSSFNKGSNADSFFIRPEDLKLYEQAIDVIDFKINDQEKEDVLYTIYKRGTFNAELGVLIESLHMTVPNLFIRPEFGQNRLNCGQRCKIPGKSCHLCETQFILTNTVLSYFEQDN